MDSRSDCELCAAERVTEWFYEDDVCWIAECEQCWVPMVVWKTHDPNPPQEVRVELHRRLVEITGSAYTFDCYVDEQMRTISDHYHAHARPRGGYFGHGMRRR